MKEMDIGQVARWSGLPVSTLRYYEKIGLLEHDFSIERGELTPKLSVKRRVVDKTYKSTIDALYAEGTSEG